MKVNNNNHNEKDGLSFVFDSRQNQAKLFSEYTEVEHGLLNQEIVIYITCFIKNFVVSLET